MGTSTIAEKLHDERIAERLRAAGLDPEYVARVAATTVTEDLGGGVDVTSEATVAADARTIADYTARKAGVAAGVAVAAAVIDLVSGGDAEFEFRVEDGEAVQPGTVLFTASGRTRDLLTAERSALNLLCHLSGIAGLTRQWVDAVAGTGAQIRDTRKTTPGLRLLEKYAVRCGGGVNHRMFLSDAALIKDNHVLAAGGVVEAFAAVRAAHPDLPVEVEVDTLDQLLPVVDARRGDAGRAQRALRPHPARGQRRPDPRSGPRRGRHRRGLHLRRRPHPLRGHPRHRLRLPLNTARPAPFPAVPKDV
jgi:nicotinate-nucleotide pyrophosphorylase (carboxylating)